MLHYTAYASQILLSIESKSVLSINGYNMTSRDLLGITIYGATKEVRNDTYLKELNTELGVNTLSFAGDLSAYLLPPNQTEAIKCCNTTQGLKSYINSGEACKNYLNHPATAIWSSSTYMDDTTLTTFLYLKDNCRNTSFPTIYHCYGPIG